MNATDTSMPQDLKEVLDLAPIAYERYADNTALLALFDTARSLEALIAHASGLAAYIDARAASQDHRLAVRAYNTKRRQVRRVFGYKETRDLTF